MRVHDVVLQVNSILKLVATQVAGKDALRKNAFNFLSLHQAISPDFHRSTRAAVRAPFNVRSQIWFDC